MKILKGIGAILAGFIFIVISHTATDFVLEKLGIFPPSQQGFNVTWMIVTATLYRTIYTVIGGYLTAALAPDPPMRYVMILGVIGLALGTIAAIVTIPMKLGPAWYPVALAVLALPSVWLGGKLRTRNH
jgi:hypothetical protein